MITFPVQSRRRELRLLGLLGLGGREYDLCGIIAVGAFSHVRLTDAVRGSVASGVGHYFCNTGDLNMMNTHLETK